MDKHIAPLSEMRRIIHYAFDHARRANGFSFENGERGEFAAVGEAACAYADFRALWCYTKLNPEYDRPEVDDLMKKAEIFQRELSTNVATNHSHQWTNIEYGSLIKSGSQVADLLLIDDLFTKKEVSNYLSD